MENDSLQIVECPRDAMQGWSKMISTSEKVRYINSLLKVGFHSIDFGSFVSPKAIPQMADTAEVLEQLDLQQGHTPLLAIVANRRGAEQAAEYEQIQYLGFPFSISATFQMRNTNSTQEESWNRIAEIQEICLRKNKTLVVYLSMGFGNPYGDPYNASVLHEWADKMVERNISILSLADTVGVAEPEDIQAALQHLIPLYPKTLIGVHLHSSALNWEKKLAAAWQSGCRRFDGALKGIGGCPMAQNELVGNMPTEKMIAYFSEGGQLKNINNEALENSMMIASEIFGHS